MPTFVCQDVGHAPHPSERDRYRWLQELGKITKITHLQQSDENNSRHWPLYPGVQCRRRCESTKNIEKLSKLQKWKKCFLALEVFHREVVEQEPRVIPEIKQSVDYWRKYLGEKEIRPVF